MKKVGTITAALGFIYLGVWMVFRNANSTLATELFKWWPILIVFLGIEILVYFGTRNSEQRIGFNFLIVVVLFLFIGINGVQFIGTKIDTGIKWFGNKVNVNDGIDFFNSINESNCKIINSKVTLQPGLKTLNILANNGDIRLRKSQDSNIKIDANIYADKDYKNNEYNINTSKSNEAYIIDIRDSYIKKSEINLYIPEGYNIKINSDNVRIKSEEDIKDLAYDIKAQNGSMDLAQGRNLQVDFNNGSVKVRDIKDVNIKSNNGSVNLDGDIENIHIKSNNGAVNVNNKFCKNVDINLNLGAIKFNTLDKNIDLNIDIDHGPVDINGTKRLNSSVKETMGTGEGKVKIQVDNGAVIVRNQE
ncbi:hypothetical protein HMPREF1982_01348 [Clostridiales bacterium oral taxon 876 str. F0540]|nr:hypothetical protein HMPREF1982_01348 [Clostridiales bacterium oral taxon 876 str. F0540]